MCLPATASAAPAKQGRAVLPGDLVAGFGSGGVKTIALGRGERERATDVAGLPGGGFVVAGRSGSTGLLARFTPRGTLDRTFGTRGSTGTPGIPWKLVGVDADGKIIATGIAEHHVIVARFLSDGSVDHEFGENGVHRFDPDPDSSGRLPDLQLTGMAVVKDRVLVAGVPERCRYDDDYEQFFPCLRPFVLRLGRDGSPDTSYGDQGVLRAYAGDVSRTVGLLPDGRAIMVGTEEYGYDDDWSSTSYARFFDAEGQPDRSIGRGNNGRLTLPTRTGSTADPATATVDRAGRILLVTGNLYRFLPDGKMDFWTSFYSDEGQITAGDLTIDHRNRPVLAGYSRGRSTLRPWAVRLNSVGNFDPAFSNDGIALSRRPGNRGSKALRPTGIVQGLNGRSLLVGTEQRGERLRLTISAHHGGERRVPKCFGQEVTWLGTNGPDRVRLGGGTVAGLGGDDRISLKSGAVCGGSGDDRITGSAKQVDGGSGDDLIRSTGRTYAVLTSRVSNWLSGGTGNDTIVGSGVNDSVRGGPGNDTLKGLRGRDRIHGGPGRDQILGGAGYDRLYGGSGRDLIRPGTGEEPRTYYRGKRRGVWTEFRRSGNRLMELRIKAWEKCDGSRRSRSEFQITDPLRIHPRTGKFRLRPKRAWFEDQLIGRIKGNMVIGTYEYYSVGDDTFPTCYIVGDRKFASVKFKAKLVPTPRDVVVP
ncbi:MAG: hypothetical protein M3Y45_10185 [Actinomycetota bacterium]|nr:hypothetical protein [Actinomycetota bacterium]